LNEDAAATPRRFLLRRVDRAGRMLEDVQVLTGAGPAGCHAPRVASSREAASMKARASAFIATSLDGFIARRDGSIDWLDDVQALIPEGEDCGYLTFMASIDCLVMGRHSFERVLMFEEWPYGQLPVYVMSHAPVSVPVALATTVHSWQGTAEALVARLSNRGFHHLYVDGGQTIHGFLRAGLLDEITITVVPILLGEGRPLFGPLPHDVELTLMHSRAYEFGFVQSTYRVEASAATQ
jgi:dihydrofolate reductase